MMKRRIIAIMLIIMFVVSYIPAGYVAKAAGPPTITKVYLNGETDSIGDRTLKYEILGTNFNDPRVWINYFQIIPDYWDSGRIIIEINDDNEPVFIEGDKQIYVTNADESMSPIFDFRVEVPPYITGISKDKVYVGETLNIFGTGFTEKPLTNLYISGKCYDIATEVDILSDSMIHVETVKAPVTPDMRDIMITRDSVGTNPSDAVRGMLRDSINVVGKLGDIEVISLEPDAGSILGDTIIRMMGDEANNKCNFQDDMKVYIGDNLAPVDSVGTIKNELGEVIGLQAKTPPGTPGPKEIIIKDEGEHNEYVVPFTFTYLQADNALILHNISPTTAKETEQKIVTVTGRNIATINLAEIQNITFLSDEGYDPVAKEYTLKFTGTYGDPPQPVTIERKIKLTIGGIASILPTPVFDTEEDSMQGQTPVITLDPPVAKTVDVVVTTETIVTGAVDMHRVEEYVLEESFTYTCAKTIPAIDKITPDMGPYNQDIFVTIEGSNFQVVTETVFDPIEGEIQVTKYPVVEVGNKTIDPNSGDYMEVYNDQDVLLDGKKYVLGTRIITKIPAAPDGELGYVGITVTNPDGGAATKENLFEFKDPPPQSEWPVIEDIQPNRGNVDGGDEVKIYGKRFDYVGGEAKCIVTIGGALADIVNNKSSSNLLTIITPKGTEGPKTVQIINEDGSMAQVVDGYYYAKVCTTPEIYSIVPDFGGEGTQVIIKGKDFMEPDPESAVINNKIGTRVLLDGVDVNSYLKDEFDNIQFDPVTGEIFFDPDEETGKRVEVIDSYTLKVTIPPGLPIGSKDVTVLNPDTAEYTVVDGFYYKSPASQPQIISIDPDEGTVNGGTVVTIQGSDFREGVRVFLGGVEAANVWVNGNGDLIQATAPQFTISDPDADNEAVDVTVLNYDGGSVTKQNGFLYRIPGSEPEITEILPNYGTTAGGEEVEIFGQDFRKIVDAVYGTEEIPKVYFGGVEAGVDWSNYNKLEVIIPPYHEEGKVDVVLVNPDAGTYTLNDGFEYRRSAPEIHSIVPNKGSKLGDLEIIIRGEEFKKDDLTDNLVGEVANEHIGGGEAPTIDLRVVFGDEKASKTITGGKATVIVGDIKVEYDAVADDNTKLYYVPSSGPEQFIDDAVCDIESGNYHFFIINGQEDLGDSTIVDEGIIVEITYTEIIVTRRVAPYVEFLDESTLVVKTPPVPYIGERTVYVINRDDGTAEGTFEYTNPVSNPQIIDITPNREETDAGGNVIKYLTESSVDNELPITITGSDFRTGIEVFVGGEKIDDVNLSADGTVITAVVPSGSQELVDQELEIIVQNTDGKSVNSSELPIPRYFVYKMPGSHPTITEVKPSETSAAGGNEVIIEGNDFREEAKVFIGATEAAVTGLASDGTWIKIETPEGLDAEVYDITIQNKDFGTATKEDGITIVSTPEIDQITDEDGRVIDKISFLGGQTIKIEGTGFQSGLKVIFGGEIKYIGEAPNEEGIEGINHEDEKIKVIDGTEATGVQVENGIIINLTTPAGVEGDVTVIVINPDSGVSNVYGMEYTLPIPDAPEDLDVSLVYDRYVKLEWPKVDDAIYYEIYVSKSKSGTYRFIESTTRNVYYITKLDSDTKYYFKVRAVNKFGSSTYTAYASITTEDTNEEDKDGGLVEENKTVLSGNKAVATIGTEGVSSSSHYLFHIDLSGDSYQRLDKKELNIAGKVVKEVNRIFLFDIGDIKLQFSPRTFYMSPISTLGTSSIYDAYARLTMETVKGYDKERCMKYLPGRKVIVSDLIRLSFEIQNGKEITKIEKLISGMDAQFVYNDASLRRVKEDSLKVYRFDAVTNKWVEMPGRLDAYNKRVYGRVEEEGFYAVLGEW